MQPFFRTSLAAVLLAVLPVWAQQGTIQSTVTEVLKALDIAVQQTDQGIIRGTVTDGEDATPLPSANLNLVGTMRGTMTGDDGTFFLAVPPGSYTLQATFIGYQAAKQSVEVAAGEMATVDFSLNASPVALGEEFVVVGSRTVRTAIETPAPVDVISELEIRQSGQTEINQTLRQLAPSFNASHQTISDGTDHINPASLRGLGPDQVLVLINGKRRHSSALVHVNGTFGRGTVGVDLNAIPKAAVERIEILRDGAAAQYGSDAIAGVINIVLKDDTEGIQLNNLVGTTGEGDGDQVKTDVNYGFGLGDGGYINVTGEFLKRDRTRRGGQYTADADDANIQWLKDNNLPDDAFNMNIGQSKATVGGAFYNAAYPLAGDAEFYSFGGLSYRRGEATGFYRLPGSQPNRVVFELYPNGFLPEINPDIEDRSFSAGVRGAKGKWDVDFSVTQGGNGFKWNIENTNNASMGADSPTSVNAGRLGFNQTSGNLDLVRPLDTAMFERTSLVLGGEFRVENYQIEAGQFESYSYGRGPVDGTNFEEGKASGAQVFRGFSPASALNRFRNSISTYAGLETHPSAMLTIDVGGRFEQYSDFGSTSTGKLALRLALSDALALRATASNGFRAPSLHQVWFNSVSTQFVADEVTGELVPREVLTANNSSPVAKAFGIGSLEPETSVNTSAGITAQLMDNFSLTADYYQIAIEDRIVLTGRFADSNEGYAAILAPFRATAAQFFTNSVNTSTSGVDLVASYSAALGAGALSLSAAANFTQTSVDEIMIPEGLIAAFERANDRQATAEERTAIEGLLFDREARNRLEDALPRTKVSVSARYSQDAFSALVRATNYGPVEYKPNNPDNDETFSAKTLLDVDVSYQMLPGLRLSVGATNLLNTFPDEHEKDANIGSRGFVYSRRVMQFGTNGGFYYGRLSFDL
ncbi:MAG: TonB-dependent receptor [Gemmatimonadetes bacterium]|nr:TonB-dependent receptor [Gemmatimonadota bacterium]